MAGKESIMSMSRSFKTSADPADGRLHLPREFGRFADVATVLQLQLHRWIREQLRKISHRYRKFIVCSLILVSASQFAVLLSTTRPHAVDNLATAGELAPRLAEAAPAGDASSAPALAERVHPVPVPAPAERLRYAAAGASSSIAVERSGTTGQASPFTISRALYASRLPLSPLRSSSSSIYPHPASGIAFHGRSCGVGGRCSLHEPPVCVASRRGRRPPPWGPWALLASGSSGGSGPAWRARRLAAEHGWRPLFYRRLVGAPVAGAVRRERG
ncbi:hypothetical protein C2845_PM15G01760 [Panicum miliaceum]|uniref:Uncharacterized protein n=1 Tax=Panicum miliaceum TaxID=4540 RepID=A0A3L6Q8R4_PANMI|nr:hypothetical protein C2845_PM15G01760 [Panicum miliaceum]